MARSTRGGDEPQDAPGSRKGFGILGRLAAVIEAGCVLRKAEWKDSFTGLFLRSLGQGLRHGTEAGE